MALTVSLVFGLVILGMVSSTTVITKGTDFTLLPVFVYVDNVTTTLHVENDNDQAVHLNITGINHKQQHTVPSISFSDIALNDNLQWPITVHSTFDVSIVMTVSTWYGDGAARIIPDPFLGSEYIVHTNRHVPNDLSKSFITMSSPDHCNISLALSLPDNYSLPKCNILPGNGSFLHDGVFLNYSKLDHGEFIHLESDCDLTGTIVMSDCDVSVFSGSYSSTVRFLMIEHLFRSSVWGNEYLIYSTDHNSEITFTTIESNTLVRAYDYHIYHFFNESSIFHIPFYSDETVVVISSKPISVFMTTSKSLITIAPFSFFGNTSSLWCNQIDINKNITLISPYIRTTNAGEDRIQYNPFGFYGHILDADACSVPYGRYGGYISVVPNGGTKLNIEGNDVHGVDDTSLFDFSESKDAFTNAYGKRFIVHLMKQNQATYDQEITLSVILDSVPTEIEVEDFGKHTINSRCDKLEFASNLTLLVVTSNKDIALYVSVRFANENLNITYTHLAIPVDAFGNEYRLISYTFEESELKTYFQECYITSVSNETAVYIQGYGRIILGQYESYKLNTSVNEINGLLIKTSKPVGVVCGALTYFQEGANVTASPNMFASQVPPSHTWGRLFRIKLPSMAWRFRQMCISFTLSELYTTIEINEQILTDDGDVEFVMYNMDVGSKRSAIECQRFPLQDNVSLIVRSSQPILITMYLKLGNSDNMASLILSPFEQSLEELVHDFSSCNIDVNDLDENQFVDPILEFGDDQIAVTAMKLAPIVQPLVVSNQIPGDGTDNDGDGLVDEDFCQFLISDSIDVLLDIDFDGRINEDCKGCHNGFELNSTLGCSQCEIGFYRNTVGVDLCVKCENLTTLYEGAVEEDMCVVNCFEGEEFHNDTQTCLPCGVGYYKNTSSEVTNATFHDRWFCTGCPDRKTTLYNGSISSLNCTENCDAGYERDNSTGQCVPCSNNRYKPWSSRNITMSLSERWFCMNCPDGKITMEDNATMCIEECQEGEEFNITLQVCNSCLKGYFKNTTGNFNPCTPCPENTTTADMGSTTINDCKAGCFCPCHMVAPRINYTVEELERRLEELRTILAVDKKKLTSYIMKKHSAPDERIVSKAFGSLGVIVISGVLLVLFLFDVMLLKRHFKMLIENISSFKKRTMDLFTIKRRKNQISPATTETEL